MSFIHTGWLPIGVVILTIWICVWIYDQRRFSKWLESAFSLKTSFFSKLHKVLFVVSVILVSIALLDLRGPEERVDTPLSDQKTIVLIDTSASMLVEDVQPNRFKRAITVARHFVKSAVGHQVSIILFSDISKRLVPFTDDIDLLDARLAGLEDEQLKGGSSNISSALTETIQALKNETSNGKPGGNIVLITDAEENGEEFKIENTEGISVAVIGVGTVSGGKIPMRTKKGTFSGYKTYKNEDVISKLDEQYLDKIVSSFNRGKKWVVLSYSMPTEEILSFFRSGSTNTETIDQNKIRPVRSQWLVAAGVLIYILAILMGHFKSYTTLAILMIFYIAPIIKTDASTEKPTINLDELQKSWSPKTKQKIAFEFAKNDEMEQAAKLYEESKGNLTLEAKANWGTSLLSQGKKQGLLILDEVLKESDGRNVELERTIRGNVKKFLTAQGGKGGKNGEKSDEEKDDDKNQSNSGSSSSDKEGKDKKDQQGEKGKDDKGKSDKSDEGDGKDKQENKRITNVAEREREIDKKRRMMKVPALLKQLMQDDRALQSQFIDTETENKVQSRQKRDW